MSNPEPVPDPIDEALALPDAAAFENPVEALDRILEIVEAYPPIQGPHAGADEVLRRKLAHAFWRRRIIPGLVEAIPAASRSQRGDLVKALGALSTRIPKPLLDSLADSVDPGAYAKLLASQGVRAKGAGTGAPAAGPQLEIKISANRSSSWSFEKWSQIEAARPDTEHRPPRTGSC